MSFWLESWAGDNAGDVIGREPNTLLISMTTEGTGYPPGLFQSTEIGGLRVFPNCSVDSLTPGAGSVAAINVESRTGNVFAIGLAQIGFGKSEPWAPGVHLFGVTLLGGGAESSTIATAVIDHDVPQIDFSDFMPSGSELWGLFRASRTAPRAST